MKFRNICTAPDLVGILYMLRAGTSRAPVVSAHRLVTRLMRGRERKRCRRYALPPQST